MQREGKAEVSAKEPRGSIRRRRIVDFLEGPRLVGHLGYGFPKSNSAGGAVRATAGR